MLYVAMEMVLSIYLITNIGRKVKCLKKIAKLYRNLAFLRIDSQSVRYGTACGLDWAFIMRMHIMCFYYS